MTIPFGATHISMADARANLRELLDNVKTTHARYRITRNGEADAILMSVDDLEALEETLEILSDPDEVAAIREGLADIEAGNVFTLDEVRRELGL
ncbi:type II toxin-antitoxin system Phd/YefM family antitoxin [Kineosporia sp. J2-2]|uniref:Antitoxin n=1 Tax=Kineosporia corallincola TaxID=2835133 RepID=A0ABS5TDY6_9ACTN|nr:type II toxin-antitoxin system Phd/YefM family antitoxin [Kineosporia corallincola]MBT0769058.1 type II toxin-antitoxin system Phd/YefM family antitoxin [Kineosporia corallincola]